MSTQTFILILKRTCVPRSFMGFNYCHHDRLISFTSIETMILIVRNGKAKLQIIQSFKSFLLSLLGAHTISAGLRW